MENLAKIIHTIPWSVVIIMCLTLGLAPFRPPHLFEKLTMLVHGKLVRPLDILDLLLHGAPWMLLVLKWILTPWRAH